MRRVVAYVDGFNLYHGMRERYGRAYHWLDLEQLSRRLLRDDQRLQAVKYFTARVRGAAAGRLRQVRYLEALATHCHNLQIIEGRFQQKTITCLSCRRAWDTYEEKESDVNIAITMIEDAAADRFDTALVVSADSDLCPAIKAVRRVRSAARVVAVFPPQRNSDPLKRAANAVYWLGRDKLQRSQLPDVVTTDNGIKLSRPAYWS